MKEVHGTLADSSRYVARRERERERERETETETETNRQTDRLKETERDRNRDAERQKPDGFENTRPVLDLVPSMIRVSMRVCSDCMILPRA